MTNIIIFFKFTTSQVQETWKMLFIPMVELKGAMQQLWRFRSLTKQWPEFRLSIISASSQQVCEYGGFTTDVGAAKLSHQDRWSDLICLRGLPVCKSCSPLAYPGKMLVSLDPCQQGWSACVLNLAFHNLLKIRQLMKLHELSSPVHEEGQRHTSLLQICRNT